MGLYLGIDTSNYTTSAALFDSVTQQVWQSRSLLPVKAGEKGIRQSDAVFHHTQLLPERLLELRDLFSSDIHLAAAAASDRPCDQDGSYMPCFTVGISFVKGLCALSGLPMYTNSHQHGHIAAALFSAGRLDLLSGAFLAFHVSGGTTQAVFCSPDQTKVFSCVPLLSSSDLKAGQAVDRVGVMLGLPFPAGKALDALSLESECRFSPKLSVKNGSPSLSGIQNQCEKMWKDGALPCDIARFCIDSIAYALCAMTESLRDRYPDLPILYSGGVISNTIIRKRLSDYPDTVFASQELSGDNAVGSAVLAALKDAML